jgi:hypothetical protein
MKKKVLSIHPDTYLNAQKYFLSRKTERNQIKYSDAIANPAAKNVTSSLFN